MSFSNSSNPMSSTTNLLDEILLPIPMSSPQDSPQPTHLTTPILSPTPSSTPVSRCTSLQDADLILPPTALSTTTSSPSALSTSSNLPERVPRPLNCFMTYRKEKQHEVLMCKGPECNNKEVSRLVAEMWNSEPESVKEIYRQKAELARQEHARKYPDYKYRPRKRAERVRQQQEAEERRRAERRAKREERMSNISDCTGRSQQRRQSRSQRRVSLTSPIYAKDTPTSTTTTTTSNTINTTTTTTSNITSDIITHATTIPSPSSLSMTLASEVPSAIVAEDLYDMSSVAYPPNATPVHWANNDATANFTQMLLQDQQSASNFMDLRPQLQQLASAAPMAPNMASWFSSANGLSPNMTPTPSSPELLAAAAANASCQSDRSSSFSPQPTSANECASVADSDELPGMSRLDGVFMTPALEPTQLPLGKETHYSLDLSNTLEPWNVAAEGVSPFSMMLAQPLP